MARLAPKPPKRGRPPLPAAERHAARVNVRLTPDEERLLAKLIDKEQAPAVEVFRRLLRRAAH